MLLKFTIRLFILKSYNLVTRRWNLRMFEKFFRAIAQDLGLTSPDVEYIVHRGRAEGLTVYTVLLPNLGRSFDQGLAHGVLNIPLGIKLMSKSKLPHFMGSLIRKVFDRQGRLLADACPNAVRAIRQVCFLFYKTSLPHTWDQERATAEKFLENERDLREHWLSDLFRYTIESLRDPQLTEQYMRRSAIIKEAQVVIKRLFGKFRPNRIRPKHSSGSVVGGFNQLEKRDLSPVSKKPWATLGSYLTPFVSEFSNLGAYPLWNHIDYFSTRFNPFDCSEVLFVPKDSRGPRLICREPAEYQYLQQGFKDYAMSIIETHPLTAGQVNFTSQEVNRVVSKLGSITRNWSTLDLKDASDRNSLSLVRLLWSGCDQSLAYLEASRTAYTVVHGRPLELAKFAAMGSACCFPVMAINIFALLTGFISVKEGIPIEDSSKLVFVYGDDIIVPTTYAYDAMEVLEDFGFKVNKAKSFVNSPFTESCGADWFQGVLVTPVRLRCQALPTINNIVSMVKVGNSFARAGLHRTAELAYSFAEKCLGSLPYGSESASYLARWTPAGSVSSSNYKIPVGKRKLRAWIIKPIAKFDREGDYARLERVLPMMGQDLLIPEFGEYTPPRAVRLEKRTVTMV